MDKVLKMNWGRDPPVLVLVCPRKKELEEANSSFIEPPLEY